MNKLAAIAVTMAVAVACAAGCAKSDKSPKDLPPAAGSGARPLPEIPDLKPTSPGPGAGSVVTAEAAVTGTLQAREEVAVAARSSGTITKVLVDENSRVKKGELLFQLDSRDQQLARQQATNQLAAAELQLKTAQRERDRIKGLVAQNALPGQQLDQLEAQVEGARLQIAAAKNAIAMSSKQIGDASVRSPLAGVVTRKLMNVGEYATMMPPSPVVIVQDQSSLELKFRLPERTLTSVKQGDVVTVTIPSLGQVRRADVAQISPMVDPRTRTIELTAVLDNCDGGLRPGLTAEVAVGAPAGEVTAPACQKKTP
ncbi:MAG: efflux RND transporter periplasmic adaptor subunit [Kofleriaceae bacterium]|nr:MAG: efflux RND transporter periplasmic adaptor subunit [Kofleriaceae bacterium]MBZ0231904.1 efflux RND transporter periplasmic adaptor subunit [Kofleriaceae bacterium]